MLLPISLDVVLELLAQFGFVLQSVSSQFQFQMKTWLQWSKIPFNFSGIKTLIQVVIH